jgi:hypothetical protein
MKELELLKSQLTGNLEHDAPIRQEMSKLKRQLEVNEPLPDKPKDSDFECFGCGS